MKENNSDEHIGDGGADDACSTNKQCCGSEGSCLIGTVVRVQRSDILKVDDLSVTGENGRENDSENTSAFHLDTRIFGDSHVLADRSHVVPQLCLAKPPDEQAKQTDNHICRNWDRDAGDLQRDEVIEAHSHCQQAKSVADAVPS